MSREFWNYLILWKVSSDAAYVTAKYRWRVLRCQPAEVVSPPRSYQSGKFSRDAIIRHAEKTHKLPNPT